jgi:hypothetical protein
MTKIKDAFDETFVGINLSTCSNTQKKQEVYTFKKEHIVYNSILYNDFGYEILKNTERYDHLPNKSLSKIAVPENIKEKYYLKYGDIVISLKKPYKVFNDIIIKKDKVIATNNFAILRGINREKYYAPYLVYYIEKVGIENLLNKINKKSNELSLEDVRNIELPDIPRAKQIARYFEIKRLIKVLLKSEEKIDKILNENNQN